MIVKYLLTVVLLAALAAGGALALLPGSPPQAPPPPAGWGGPGWYVVCEGANEVAVFLVRVEEVTQAPYPGHILAGPFPNDGSSGRWAAANPGRCP